MKALKIASEEEASVNEYGVMTPARGPLDAARNHYPAVHKRLIEILQLCSSSGLIMVPSQADREGDRSSDIDKFLQGKNGSAEERLRLFRLAWDMTISASVADKPCMNVSFSRSSAHEACSLRVRPN